MQSTLFFQYCQKLVLLSADRQSVLLAKRAGEADYDGTFSFIGGKMETTDLSLVAGLKREKDEEIGSGAKVAVLSDESFNVLFRKSDGSSVVLPHIAAVFVSGDIKLSDEYSEYAWIPLAELDNFEPKIANVPQLTAWAASKVADVPEGRFTTI